MDTPAGEPIAARGRAARWTSSVRVRIASRHLMNVAILLALPMLLAATLNRARTLLVDPDIWWHMANARIFATTHHAIWADPYSFTVAGHYWIDWEWLSEQVFWGAYQLMHLQGIYLVSWLLLGANILFVYFRGYRLSRSADAALWTSAIGFTLMTVNSGPRTIEFAYICMSTEMLILEEFDRGNKKLIWFLPPLFALWINLHGFWFAGIVLLAMYIGFGLFSVDLGAFEQKALTAADRNRLLAALGLSIVVLPLTPYGWHLMWNPVDMMLNQKSSVSTIAEWLPIDMSMLAGKFVVVAIALMVIANLIRGRKWRLYELAFVCLAWYAAVAHRRFSYFAAVLTVPMLARDAARAFKLDPDADTIPGMNVLMAGIAAVVIAMQFPSEAVLQERLHQMFPMKTIATMDPNWRTFNWDYVGGMMAFQGKPSFIDSRFDSFDQVGIMDEYGRIMAGDNAIELMKKYRVDHALTMTNHPITYLLERTPGWTVIGREKAWEGEYVLFAKTAEQPATTTACAQAVSSTPR